MKILSAEELKAKKFGNFVLQICLTARVCAWTPLEQRCFRERVLAFGRLLCADFAESEEDAGTTEDVLMQMLKRFIETYTALAVGELDELLESQKEQMQEEIYQLSWKVPHHTSDAKLLLVKELCQLMMDINKRRQWTDLFKALMTFMQANDDCPAVWLDKAMQIRAK
jgi:hypothetical protein